MPDYERTETVAARPDALFAYLSDVRNLPKYFARMTSAEPGDGEEVRTTARIDMGDGPQEVAGEAWFRVDDDGNALAWGSEGENDYSGELDVSPDGDGARVAVRLHTKVDDRERIERDLDETLGNIKRLVEGS
jgi:carbon monoxide dehydrogenase subunit G